MRKVIVTSLMLLIHVGYWSIAQEKEYVVGRGGGKKASVGQTAKPVASKTMEGMKITVWLDSMESVGATHLVKVKLANAKTKKTVDEAEVWFHIVYPGGKNLMPRLKQNEGFYEGIIDLSEKGKYKLMVHVNAGEKHPVVVFSYLIK